MRRGTSWLTLRTATILAIPRPEIVLGSSGLPGAARQAGNGPPLMRSHAPCPYADSYDGMKGRHVGPDEARTCTESGTLNSVRFTVMTRLCPQPVPMRVRTNP